jgi:2-polyprenyl-3-methyl-5-hydroxy-6-metoxy-1,4-benzoquinol methylase
VPLRRDKRRHTDLTRNIESLWKGLTCDLVQCHVCRFTFPIPYVAGDKEFYELAYGVPRYPRHRWEYDRAVEFLKSLSPCDSPRILELGAGVGQFIKVLLRVSAYRADRIVATDYSSPSVNELSKLGVEAKLASVFELAACPGSSASFDAVCAFQSVEHMANVAEIVMALKTMVKPAGLLIVSVPNGPAIEFNERHLSCFDMPPNHVGRWYPETFAALANRTGLELVAHEVEPRHLPRLLRDATESYVRGFGASKPRSLVGRAQAIQNRVVRRILSATVGSVAMLPLLPVVRKLGSGYAQLAVFRVPAS